MMLTGKGLLSNDGAHSGLVPLAGLTEYAYNATDFTPMAYNTMDLDLDKEVNTLLQNGGIINDNRKITGQVTILI